MYFYFLLCLTDIIAGTERLHPLDGAAAIQNPQIQAANYRTSHTSSGGMYYEVRYAYMGQISSRVVYFEIFNA